MRADRARCSEIFFKPQDKVLCPGMLGDKVS